MHTEPFFILPKSAHDRIIKRVEGTNAAFCMAVYTSLRRLANDACLSEGPVELTINQIASGAGCCYRKAAASLRLLKNEGLVHIEGRKIPGTSGQLPSTYSFGTTGLTSITIGGISGTEPPAACAEIKKEPKESKESWAKSPPANGPRPKSSHQKATRPRNELLESLAGIDGSQISEITTVAWGGINRALSQIKGVSPDVTPEEIKRRADNYHRHFLNVAISPYALAKHWARCHAKPCHPKDSDRREAVVKQIDLTTKPSSRP